MRVVMTIILMATLIIPARLNAAMSSTNYYIYADSISTGGSFSSGGGTFSLQDTLGEAVVGVASSSSYEIRGGYQSMDNGYITLNLSDNLLDLGTLSTTSVKQDSVSVTVSTDSATGYVLSVGAVSGAGIAAVTDGEVTTGATEFGVAIAGMQSVTSSDIGVIENAVLAQSSGPITNSISTLTFKAAMADGLAQSDYNQTVTFVAAANL